MRKIVTDIIALYASGQIELQYNFIKELIREFLHNDFDVPYWELDQADLLNYTETMKFIDLSSQDDEYRSKVANLLALLNLSKIMKDAK